MLALLLVLAGCAGTSATEDTAIGDGALVGGQRSVAHAASGYLVRADAPSTVACNATLIAPTVVVTPAHCVTDATASFAFGTGDVGGATVAVTERHAHPDFHAESEGVLDIDHVLRKFDVAYLVLATASTVTPSALTAIAPTMGAAVTAFGYRAGKRVTTPATILFGIQLGSDPIFEVHPSGNSALCVADGDEGSPVIGADGALVGFYVGSVTQGFTDCRRGSQYLDGYESMFGYADFLRAGIAAVR